MKSPTAPTSSVPAVLLAALFVTVALAGCVQPADAGLAPSDPTDASDAVGRPLAISASTEVVTPPPAAPDLAADLSAPPRLVPGEWWRIRLTSDVFGDAPEFVRVVADVQEDGYVVGMPHEAWFKEAIAYHSPGFGDIGFDLSYEMHDHVFEPVRFPLVEGATWETSFGGGDLVAVVESVEGTLATVRFDPPPSEPPGPVDSALMSLAPFDLSPGARLVYDAAEHEVVHFESALGTWDVLEHGYGFEGWVTIPRGQDAAVVYGQFGPATPGGPVLTRAQTIDGGYNRLTVMHGIFALSPGAYRIRDVAPNGTELVTESIGERGFKVRFHEATDPDGEWTFEDVVGGAGLTYHMGIAYHQYDVRLPDGIRRADHSHPVIR